MQNNPQDKKQVPANDQMDLSNENTLSQQHDETKEEDLDDLVHNNFDEEIQADTEVDADDAVHNIPSQPLNNEDHEIDPDDLVHGN